MACNNFTTFHVEGNIGVGKTTFIESVRKKWNEDDEKGHVVVFSEHINSDALDAFYNDPKTMGIIMQSFMFGLKMYSDCIYEMIKSCPLMIDGLDEGNSIVPYNGKKTFNDIKHFTFIHDRSLLGVFIFTLTNYIEGNIDQHFYKAFTALFMKKVAPVESLFSKDNSHLIYLSDSTNAIYKRIHSRNRKEEASIPKDYIIILDCIYSLTIIHMTRLKKKPIILHWDEFNNVENITQEQLKQKKCGIIKCYDTRAECFSAIDNTMKTYAVKKVPSHLYNLIKDSESLTFYDYFNTLSEYPRQFFNNEETVSILYDIIRLLSRNDNVLIYNDTPPL